MAAFSVNAGDLAEVTILGGMQGQTVLNVFHYNYTGAATRADGPAALGALLADFDAKVIRPALHPMLALLTAEWGFRYIRGQVINPIRKPYIDLDAGVTVGSVAPPAIPSDTNITVSLRTLAVGRGLTGNKKITGLALSDLNGNLFTGIAQAAWTQWAQHLMENLNDDVPNPDWTPVVWSRKRPNDRRGIFSVASQAEVRVLRRRQYGKGV